MKTKSVIAKGTINLRESLPIGANIRLGGYVFAQW